jgi:hypothetical protein
MAIKIKCTWCGVGIFRKPHRHAHRNFCRLQCVEDFLDMQVRLNESRKLSRITELQDA